MGHRAAIVLAVAGLWAGCAQAADLPAHHPQPVHPQDGHICVIQGLLAPVEVYRAPRGAVWGTLPTGMEVVVLDAPWSPRQDLWVRIKPPRERDYYGWVETATFVCL